MKTVTVNLPNGIVSDGTRITEVEIRDLNGFDEDLLRSKKFLKDGGVVNRLLKRCITSIGGETNTEAIAKLYSSMPLADVAFLLVALRQNSLGDKYTFEFECPNKGCEKPSKQSILLSSLLIDQQPEECFGKTEFTSSIDGVTVVFRNLLTEDGDRLESVKQQYRDEQGTRELLLQIVSVDGKRPTPKDLKEWSWGFRNKVRNAMDAVAGGIDLDLSIACPHCDRVFKDKMPVDMRDFFFPAGDSLSQVSEPTPYRVFGSISPTSEAGGTGAQGKSVAYLSLKDPTT